MRQNAAGDFEFVSDDQVLREMRVVKQPTLDLDLIDGELVLTLNEDGMCVTGSAYAGTSGRGGCPSAAYSRARIVVGSKSIELDDRTATVEARDWSAMLPSILKGSAQVSVPPFGRVKVDISADAAWMMSEASTVNVRPLLAERFPDHPKSRAEIEAQRQRDAKERATWRAAGFTDDEATQWRGGGYSPDKAAPWKKAGVTDVGEAGLWAEDALAMENIAQWKQANGSYASWKKWKTSGFAFADALAWETAGSTPDEAKKWLAAGFTAETGPAWKATGVDPVTAQTWIREGFDPATAQPWCKAGLSPKIAKPWIESGATPETATTWAKVGLTPKEADEWKAAGFTDGSDAQAWFEYGVPPAQAKKWKSQGVAPEEAGWLQSGFKKQEIQAWQDAGFRDIEDAKPWHSRGVSPSTADLLNEQGFTPENSGPIGKQCRVGVSSIEDLILSNPYEVKGDCYLFAGTQLQLLKRNVGLYSTGGNKVMHISFGKTAAPTWIQNAVVRGVGVYKYRSVNGARRVVPKLKLVILSQEEDQDE